MAEPPHDHHARYLATRQFGSLDGLRCLCILAVIWHHVPRAATTGLSARGFLGVDMFFVISGFLIVTLLLRERARTGGISLKNFYARRILRIFPPYYFLIFSTLLVLVAVRPGSETARNMLEAFPFLVTYTSNWVVVSAVNLGILWSLATEEQFYLVWPAIEKYLKPWMVSATLAVVIVVNQLANFRLLDGPITAIYGTYPALEILQSTYTPIALGVLLAHALNDPRWFRVLDRLTGWPGAPPALAAVLLSSIAWAPADISGWPRLAIQTVMTIVLAALVVREDHSARWFLAWRPIRNIGVISYGMYLYHMFAIHGARALVGKLRLESTAAYFVVSVVLTILVAAVSFRFLETPALRFKRYFGSNDVPRTSSTSTSTFAMPWSWGRNRQSTS